MAGKRVTQADVARLAGVSRATVSLVLNPQADSRVPISAETRQRVLQAIAELGYMPNPAAQMLAGGHNNLIGVFVYQRNFPIEQQDFFYYYLVGIERGAQEANYNLLLFTGSPTPDNRHIYVNGQNTLSLAAGSILLGTQPDRSELCRLMEEGYPFVYIGRREVPGCEIDWVTNDYAAGCRQVMEHVIGLGHRTIGILGLELNLESHRDRLSGCRSIAEQHPDVRLVILDEAAGSSSAALAEAVRVHQITVLLCHGEDTIDLIRGTTSYGITVPVDLSVVMLSPVDDPRNMLTKWTHLHFDRAAVGEAAVHLLVSRLKGEWTGPQQLLLPCTLVVGETTTSPPVRVAR